MRIVDEIRRLFTSSKEPARAALAAALAEHRARQRAQRWAREALPFVLDRVRTLARGGDSHAELTAATLPRRLRRIPPGGLAELGALFQSIGFKVESGSSGGYVLSWE